MEPDRQIEIQLGHMCNNRCVFCVSGQRTQRREAFPVEADPILARIREAHESGMRKLTLLGGEPTLQPQFFEILRFAVKLGFDEIVLFTNGVKTAREGFMDEVLAVGGNVSFRFSFQGANRAAHERTTLKEGSFQRLVDSLKHAHKKRQHISVNMCVVKSNFESVADFPALLAPYGVRQLHLDMMRPLDAGDRTEDELRSTVPHYSGMVPYLEKMIAGFPPGFDVNIGNLPYCVAPHLARWIHHDGEQTLTVAIDQKDDVSEPWNKYETKRRDKSKPDSCRTCVFDSKCSGVFETYREFYGVSELVPVTLDRLALTDPARELLTLHLAPIIAELHDWKPPSPFGVPRIRVESTGDEQVILDMPGPDGSVIVALRKPGSGGIGAAESFALHLIEAPDTGPHTLRMLAELLAFGGRVVHPVGEDAAFLAEKTPRLRPLMDRRLAAWLKELRSQAPFGQLAWNELAIGGAGRAASLTLTDSAGAAATVTLTIRGDQIAGAYKLASTGTPSAELADGLRALFGVLRTPPVAPARPVPAMQAHP